MSEMVTRPNKDNVQIGDYLVVYHKNKERNSAGVQVFPITKVTGKIIEANDGGNITYSCFYNSAIVIRKEDMVALIGEKVRGLEEKAKKD